MAEERVARTLQRISWLAVAASAALYALLHLVLLGALVTFGQRAGGYPLQVVALCTYALLVLGGSTLAWRWSVRAMPGADRLVPLLGLAVFLAMALCAAFFATRALASFGLRAAYPPYVDDAAILTLMSVALALWVVALALATRWRGLLLAGMAAQGMALLLDPGVLAISAGYGLWAEGYVLFALPALYLGAAMALGWRPSRKGLAAAAGLTAAGVALATLLARALPFARVALAQEPHGTTWLALYVIVTGAAYVGVLGLPFWAWRLRRWAAEGERPGATGAVGAGLALVAGVSMFSWNLLGPGGVLPAAGQYLGWSGKTVPEGAYGVAGELLAALKVGYPWLVGAAALLWLGSALARLRRLGVWRAAASAGLPAWLVALGFGMLFQGPVPLAFLAQPLPVQGFAGFVLPTLLGGRGLGALSQVAFTLHGVALLWLGAQLSGSSARWRPWCTFGAMLLALAAALVLTAGLPAGVTQGVALQRGLTLQEFRHAAQLRLALSLAANAILAVLGWVTWMRALRALITPGGPAALSARAMRGGLVAVVGMAAVGGMAFWQLTGLPIAQTWPPDGAMEVPTNASLVVRLRPGERNWGPGISAAYTDTGEYVMGTTGGGLEGETWFTPANGWRAQTRVKVRVSGPASRVYEFSFTTGNGPSADVVLPPGPGPVPTAPAVAPANTP